MKLIKASYEILTPINREEILKSIEVAGRTCYKSEDKITEDSASKFVKMITSRGHLSVIEHQSLSVRFVCDRGVSHELVRHRIASFSQESTRYCNYSKDKFDNGLTFIIPSWFSEKDTDLILGYSMADDNDELEMPSIPVGVWGVKMQEAEWSYNLLIEQGWTPQQARSILPNSLKTEIVVTANLREWREILRQRASEAAHPQMREIMIPLQEELRKLLPEIF